MEQKIWINGSLVNKSDAKVPILTQSLQYGTGIFEGIRSYESEDNSFVFRLYDHMVRFTESAKIYRMNLGFTAKDLSQAVIDTIKENGLKSCYVRPFAFFSDETVSLATDSLHVSVAIATVDLGKYFGSNAHKGLNCMTSSWRRINSNILPVHAKASGNYLNSCLASTEAKLAGYDESLMLSGEGYISEGPGENIFMVKNGVIVTPGMEASILKGITRDSVITLAKDLGYTVIERQIHRDEIYSADEAFLCGTAAEITHVRSLDRVVIGDGNAGIVTQDLRDNFEKALSGKSERYKQWLTPVY
jgi:branched-chain amino acid aminotransferase